MSRSERIARIGLWLAIAGGIMLALAPVGYRGGWWPLRFSFYYLMGGAVVIGVLAVIVSLIAAFLTRRTSGAPGFAVALAGVLLGALVGGYPASQIVKARRVPPIHDVTTDVANPPTFVALAPARRSAPNGLDYAGGEVADQQKRAYPDVTTLRSSLAPADLFARAAKICSDSGWQVVDSAPNDGRIEATATTSLFGFKDDIVLRVRAAEKGSELDMRSMSRIGRSDVGTNAARIRAFMDKLRASGA
jgi:uncharacterized protein (DUF1499 family)